MIPETQDPIPSLFNLPRSAQISRVVSMLSAIEFDDESRAAADKVRDEWTNQSLTPKVRAAQRYIMPKPMPQHSLGISRLGTHSARKVSLTIIHDQ